MHLKYNIVRSLKIKTPNALFTCKWTTVTNNTCQVYWNILKLLLFMQMWHLFVELLRMSNNPTPSKVIYCISKWTMPVDYLRIYRATMLA